MRQILKQYFLWNLIAFAGITIFLILYNCKSNNFMENNMNSAHVYAEDDNVISVHISEIMSGQPIVLPQDDKRVINYIWSKKHLLPPSEDEYNLEAPAKDPSSGQGQYIRKLLKNMTSGFFIECGALDGETRSNTLFMEKALGWKGLLIEADPINFDLLKKKHRKAWISNTCLSVKPFPHTATYLQSFAMGKIMSEEKEIQKNHNHVNVQCMPLFSLLTAINVRTVDYFSLDVEGAELQVLKTIPFDKVFIRTLSVENVHTVEGKDELRKFMESQGYQMIKTVKTHRTGAFAHDFIFVHKNANINPMAE